jgi:hypothetical protein
VLSLATTRTSSGAAGGGSGGGEVRQGDAIAAEIFEASIPVAAAHVCHECVGRAEVAAAVNAEQRKKTKSKMTITSGEE